VTRVVLLRHGETDWNSAGRLQGVSDIELNAVGVAQARRAAKVLASVVRPGALIVTSPLVRAVATAQPLADALGVAVVQDARLRERAYGVWEGLTMDERRAWDVEQHEVWAARGEPAIAGYEGHQLLANRMVEAIEEHVRAAETAGRDLVVVSHSSALRVGMTALVGLPLTSRSVGGLDNTAWATMFRHPAGDWTVQHHNTQAD